MVESHVEVSAFFGADSGTHQELLFVTRDSFTPLDVGDHED